MNYFSKHKEGIILSVLFHIALVILLMKLGFFTPLPLPEDKGVLVDFGNSAVGMRQEEPAPKPQQQEVVQQASTPPPAPVAKPVQSSGNEEVMTQNFEKTVAIDEGKKKQEEENKKKLEEEARIKKAQEEQKRKEDEARRKIEQERLAEQRRLAEAKRQDSIRKAEDAKRIADINQRAQNVFGTGGSGQNSSSSGQGVTYQPGNQGSESGTTGANQYGAGGGQGISFNLSGRSAESLPKPSYPGQEEGTVVVQVTVDQNGVVTKAEPGVRGSTSLDKGLLDAARRAALATRFNPDKNAPAFQTGTITYRFSLN